MGAGGRGAGGEGIQPGLRICTTGLYRTHTSLEPKACCPIYPFSHICLSCLLHFKGLYPLTRLSRDAPLPRSLPFWGPVELSAHLITARFLKTFLWYSSTLKLLQLPMLRSVWLLYKNYLQTFAKGAGFSLLLPRLSTIGSIVTNGNISCPLGKYISWHQKY